MQINFGKELDIAKSSSFFPMHKLEIVFLQTVNSNKRHQTINLIYEAQD